MEPGRTAGSSSHRFAKLASRLEELRSSRGDRPFGVEVPLRICPLGAHVDHQNGIVSGMTIDRSVFMVVAPSEDSLIEVESLDFEGRTTLDLNQPLPSADGSWGDYLRAAVSVLGDRSTLNRGFRAVIDGPLAGAGLSSSAAVLIAYIAAAARVNKTDLSAQEVPDLVRRAENEYVGVSCGLLDPSVIIHSQPDALAVIDCFDGSVRHARRPTASVDPAILVACSGESRRLVASGFNNRVNECAQAAGRLLEFAGLKATSHPKLRSVEPDVFAEYGNRLPEPLRLRAAHFFAEMERVSEGVTIWQCGDLGRFGELMIASGESSISNYECGTPVMVALFELLASQPGVYGARFSGAGFGGSCIALVEAAAANDVARVVERRHRASHPELAGAARVHRCRPAGTLRFVEEGG